MTNVYRKGQALNTARIDLEGYEDEYCIVRTNPKLSIMGRLGSGDTSEMAGALVGIILEAHVTDEDGNALPIRLDETDVQDLPLDKFFAILEGVNEAMQAAPWFPKAKGKTGENTETP